MYKKKKIYRTNTKHRGWLYLNNGLTIKHAKHEIRKPPTVATRLKKQRLIITQQQRNQKYNMVGLSKEWYRNNHVKWNLILPLIMAPQNYSI